VGGTPAAPGYAVVTGPKASNLDNSIVSEQENVKFVRGLWSAIARGGLEHSLELTDPTVEWRPHAAGGRVLTSEELLRFFVEFQGERQLLEATPYSFHSHNNFVLASGSFRLRGRDRMSEFQIHFVYEFEDGRLLRGATYATRREALQAMGLTEEP
jgi:ketosteroid isomerase-like protein